MFLNHLRYIQPYKKLRLAISHRLHQTSVMCLKTQENTMKEHPQPKLAQEIHESVVTQEMFPTAKTVPMVVKKETVVLSFDEVPGPKALKYLSYIRQYVSEIGTQLTACVITAGVNIQSFFKYKRQSLSSLFDEYGPVVRFISPVGADVVLLNHPEHIEKVYAMEGDYPIRSTLDSLEKYRSEHRDHTYGLYTVCGADWTRQRSTVVAPLQNAISYHFVGISGICDYFADKIYSTRNYHDESSKDLYKELHKWAFDCMGLIVFSKNFGMLDTELVYSQCDKSWLYHSLDKATESIIKCESGLQLWKLFPTPAWTSLVKHCDNLDCLIGKYVMEVEQSIPIKDKGIVNELNKKSMIHSMLMREQKMSAEDIATMLMDMLLIGVNTMTSSMSFLLYNLAKNQKVQKALYKEICSVDTFKVGSMELIEQTPYLQACIKETLRLVPPIPLLTRILPRNIILDGYNIPSGTLIVMSTLDASHKEGNYEHAQIFMPERWLASDSKDYHAFASIPFGFGPRKCLGQNTAETMLSLQTISILKKYKLEYHYGDIQPTKSFISRPNKALKLRFVDRV